MSSGVSRSPDGISFSNSSSNLSASSPPGYGNKRIPSFPQSDWNFRERNLLAAEPGPSQIKDLHQSPVTSQPHRSSHLPTPQSPNTFGQYVHGIPHSPESLALFSGIQNTPSSSLTSFFGPHLPSQKPPVETSTIQSQIMTPESSPQSRDTSIRYSMVPSKLPHQSAIRSTGPTSPNFTSITPEANNLPILAPAPRLVSPVSASEQATQLSSPFMGKVSLGDQRIKAKTPIHFRHQSESPGLHNNGSSLGDSFFRQTRAESTGPDSTIALSSRPHTTTPPRFPAVAQVFEAGGELKRIHQAALHDSLTHQRQVESRRPEYLKRTKRTLLDIESPSLEENGLFHDQDKSANVGITDSPIKGRRLKLFQETSEESFEESLMAGGYGRYRTADWVRQPQPILTTPGKTESVIVSFPEPTEEEPPTEKELKKQKRLAAFRSRQSPRSSSSNLLPVELEGKGRVLVDTASSRPLPSFPSPSPMRKKMGSRKRKKASHGFKEKQSGADETSTSMRLPNWPDEEFPWRIRSSEVADITKAEEEEKLKSIEQFLDRSSDEDEDEPDGSAPTVARLSISQTWTKSHGIGSPSGRGLQKTLYSDASDRATTRSRGAFHLSDPADAKTALLSKKSIRALSYRRSRRVEDSGDVEALCICNGRDDGRELVQCDSCQTWYHLQCIGIHDIADLGKEEDPWFCQFCERSKPPFPTIGLDLASSEPTFVPTDEPHIRDSHDGMFLHPSSPDNSPLGWSQPQAPKTPTRPVRRDHILGHALSTGPSWLEPSRLGPTTPRNGSLPHSSLNLLDHSGAPFDDSIFDPTSTPSRGIQMSAPFTTPKNSVWPSRANGLFQTPSKPGGGRNSTSRIFDANHSFSSILDDDTDGGDVASSSLRKQFSYDDSPIRWVRPAEEKGRRMIDSALPFRSTVPSARLPIEESPVMRSKHKEKP